MRSLVRETRIRLGLSEEDLGECMGSSAESVSSLERDEAAGAATTAVIQRALEAMGKSVIAFVIDQDQMDRIEQIAGKIARSVETTMALEGQTISAAVTQELYERALRKEIAKL